MVDGKTIIIPHRVEWYKWFRLIRLKDEVPICGVHDIRRSLLKVFSENAHIVEKVHNKITTITILSC